MAFSNLLRHRHGLPPLKCHHEGAFAWNDLVQKLVSRCQHLAWHILSHRTPYPVIPGPYPAHTRAGKLGHSAGLCIFGRGAKTSQCIQVMFARAEAPHGASLVCWGPLGPLRWQVSRIAPCAYAHGPKWARKRTQRVFGRLASDPLTIPATSKAYVPLHHPRGR